MTAHEVVIRLGRPFDVMVNGRFIEGVTEITVPFNDVMLTDAAGAATRAASGVGVSVREVHDAGGEDYRPVVHGAVIRPAEIEDRGEDAG